MAAPTESEIGATRLLVTEEPAAPRLSGLGRGRTVGIVSAATLVVAVFGYLREAVLAARFGVSNTMDAYFGAIFIPNILFLILIAGTLSPILIPILLQGNRTGDPKEASETFSTVTNFILLLFIMAVCAGMFTARAWLPLLFSGFAPSTTAMALRLIYMIFPALLFLAVGGVFTAVLNGFHRFTLAAIAPVLSSITVIVAASLARGDKAIYSVGIATAMGFSLQALLLLPAVKSLELHYRPTLNLRHPAIKSLLRLGTPLFFYLVVANASVFVERNLASRLSVGAVATVTYAMRLFAVPSNFLAAPLAIVAYPQFAGEALLQGYGQLRSQLSRVFRLALVLFFPVTMWTMLNALPLTRLLYEHGQFRPENSLVTSRVLMLYSIGILPNALAIILLRCFYAVQDTVTPFLAELVDLGFYVVVAAFLARHFGIEGLAITRAMAFFLVASILLFVLWVRKRLLIVDFNLVWFVTRTAFASLAMGAVSWITLRLLQGAFDSGSTPVRLAVICVVLITSGASFLGVARLLRLNEAMHVMATALQFLPGSCFGAGPRE